MQGLERARNSDLRASSSRGAAHDRHYPLEVKRQLLEAAQTRARELSAIEKDLRRWRKQAPKATPKVELDIDAAAIGEELFERFCSFTTHECGATGSEPRMSRRR